MPEHTVHWVGTGLSTGSGLRMLVERGAPVTLWGRTEEKAQACARRLGLTGRVTTRGYQQSPLADHVAEGDVVVSMLPAAEHAGLLRTCIDRKAHFACSSYTTDELVALAAEADGAGLVVLTEAGLDPGIDHALAHVLVARARAAVGDGPASAWFTSYCGGVPAVANEFRYRFSWAPQGVLSALRSPARYLTGGTETTVDRPWEATTDVDVDGETFEAYPNRDSLPFLAQYGFPAGWRPETFVRGTLRLAGWRAAWKPVFDVLRAGDPTEIAALAQDLAARYPTTDADHDRVVLVVELTVRPDGGAEWSGRYLLDLVGDDHEAAMARCVSLPLAYGVSRIRAGALTPGLHRAADDAAESDRWIAFLRDQGVL
jgi:saccharopine dehydrogenase-like NADP-dependent oxidoreductase